MKFVNYALIAICLLGSAHPAFAGELGMPDSRNKSIGAPASANLLGSTANKRLTTVTVGSGLSLSAGTLTATGGGGSGTVSNAAQYDVPYYSASGTNNTVSGAPIAGLQLDSTSGAPAAYGGVTCGANQWLTGLSAVGAANSCTQPPFSSISGTATTAQMPTFVVAMSSASAMTNYGGL